MAIKRSSLLFTIIIFASCAKLNTTTTAKNTTRPVMVGPIHYVNSTKAITLHKKSEFDIKVENSDVTSGGAHYQTTYVTRESAEKIDANLLKMVSSPKDKILVNTLFVKSTRGCFIIFCSSRIDYSGIEGGIYTKTKGAK